MQFRFLAAASALALAAAPTNAWAQRQSMPGMNMPAHAKEGPAKNPNAPKKGAGKKTAAKRSTPKKSALAAHPEGAEPKGGTTPIEAGAMPMPTPDQAPAEDSMSMPMNHSPVDHSQMDHSQMDQMSMPMAVHSDHAMAMTGALGPYPMQRESSGTAWQPDTTEHMGLHEMSGNWTLMAHGFLNLVYDHQSGPRGDDKAFVSGMLMGMARHPLGNGTLQFRASLSPDPIMGKSGYPLLLASGETANGRDRLIDRQHPHDLFMELSAAVSQNIGRKSGVFLYGGLPGEPAFGPPAFMHREAIMVSPEAPISHHWLDSTHISFGVVTAGIVLDRVKIEASRFNAREPDQHRWNVETGPLDSTAVRVSWNPTAELALQGSWGHFKDPEQLEPGVDQKRWSASALYAREVVRGWKLAGTLAWGRKTADGHSDDAYAAEASLKHEAWTIFGRGEITENRELLSLAEHDPAYQVGKVSAGVVRDFAIAEHLSLGAGGLVSLNFVPDSLAGLYGGNNPVGAMGFFRLKLD